MASGPAHAVKVGRPRSDAKRRTILKGATAAFMEHGFGDTTMDQVVARSGVSKMTVYRLVHNGDLPAVRVGRSFRVREEDANEYLRKSFFNAG